LRKKHKTGAEMLIRFSVENFLSFKDRQTLDMTAVPTCKERQEDNTFDLDSESKLLKTVVVYGANASGKSNLFKALAFFCSFIHNSSKDFQVDESISVKPFQLNLDTVKEPSFFEIEFKHNEEFYRYGFQVTRAKVVSEWLFCGGKQLFIRAEENGEDIIQIESEWNNAKGLEERTRANALFLSVCAQFAMSQAAEIIAWFNQKINQISGTATLLSKMFTIEKIQDGKYRDDIIMFLKNADMNIDNVEIKEGARIASMNRLIVQTLHHIYDNNANVVGNTKLSMKEAESLGTQKAFALSGPLIEALKTGAVLVVDEMDARLHPVFVRQIVDMFNSKRLNPLNAQLIFNTHDTNLLNCRKDKPAGYLLRRDQIYFMEKDNMEASHLYSLIEFKKEDGKKIRNDASYEKDYLNGIYGAIPFIGNLMHVQEDGE